MNPTEALTLIIPAALVMDDNYKLTVHPDAVASRDKLIVACRTIQSVDESNLVTAQALTGALARLRIDTEKIRKALKERPLEIGRRIDAAAKDFLGSVADEESRVEAMTKAHARRLAEAAEKARQEQLRLEREAAEKARQAAAEAARLEAERLAAEQAAEKARCDALEAAEAAAAPDADAEAMTAEAEAQDAARAAQLEAEAADRKLAQRLADQRQAEAERLANGMPYAWETAAKPVGRAYWDYNVVNIRALAQYGHDTGLELVEMTDRRSEVLKLLKLAPINEPPPVIPGVIVTREFKV